MTTGGIAGIVLSTYGARAGRRRGSTAQTTTSASSSPASVATATTRPSRTHEVAGGVAGEHGDPAGLQPGAQGVGERGHAAGDRPGAEPLLDVGRHPQPRRHVAQVVALGDEPVPGDQPQPLVAEVLAQPLVQRPPGCRGAPRARGGGGPGPRAARGSPAQHLPGVGVRRHVVDPAPGPGRAPARRRRRAGRPGSRRAAAASCRPRTGARGSARAAPGRARARAAGPTCGTGRGAPPAAACGWGRRPRRTPRRSRRSARRRGVSARSIRVTSWPSLASRAAEARPPKPPPTTTTRAMGRPYRASPQVGRGLDRPEAGVVLAVEVGHQRRVDGSQPVSGSERRARRDLREEPGRGVGEDQGVAGLSPRPW